MDGHRFDYLVRTWMRSASRRQTLRALAGVALGGLATVVGREAAVACLKDGKVCKRDGQCCSDRCVKDGNKKRCKAAPSRPGPFQGTCQPGQAWCENGSAWQSGCNGVDHCGCFESLTGVMMCADVAPCWPCSRDSDCIPVVGPNAICGRGRGPCAGACAGTAGSNGTYCARPCGT